MNNFQVLREEIISKSIANTWEDAKSEWRVVGMDDAGDDPETCLCGHYPIKEVFILKNMRNGLMVHIGSTCVNKFIQRNDSFAGYKRIAQDDCKSATSQLIDFAHNAKWITDSDFSFYMNTIRKRKLSSKQLQWRKSINAKIINNIKEAQVVS